MYQYRYSNRHNYYTHIELGEDPPIVKIDEPVVLCYVDQVYDLLHVAKSYLKFNWNESPKDLSSCTSEDEKVMRVSAQDESRMLFYRTERSLLIWNDLIFIHCDQKVAFGRRTNCWLAVCMEPGFHRFVLIPERLQQHFGRPYMKRTAIFNRSWKLKVPVQI